MAEDEDFEEIEEPDDPDVVDLEALEDEDVLEEDLDDDLEDDLVEDAEEDEGETVAVIAAEEEEEEDEDEDVIDPDDVEAGLDVILKDRLVAVDDDEEDEDEVPETDERGDPSIKVLAKRPGEFVCQSCFLLKHPSQLADDSRMLCKDCV